MTYDHATKAGNHADVWKHTAWLALLASVRRQRTAIVETHAGAGHYRLAQAGPWQDGIGKLLDLEPGTATGSAAVDRYLGRVRRICEDVPKHYPGSPFLSLDAVSRSSRVRLHESDKTVVDGLRKRLASEPRAIVHHGDGLASLSELPEADARAVLIDPTYATEEDWTAPASALASLDPGVQALLWYPLVPGIKVDALHQTLRAQGVAFTAVELQHTPWEQKATMYGSGVVLVGTSAATQGDVVAALPVLGPRLAGPSGWWSGRISV